MSSNPAAFRRRSGGCPSNLLRLIASKSKWKMTRAVVLHRRDESKKALACQPYLHPESRIPFDTPAATENNSGFYVECNGNFSFPDRVLPKAPKKTYPPSFKYVSPGMTSVEYLKNRPTEALFTCGFDPLRGFGVEYDSKSQEAQIEGGFAASLSRVNAWISTNGFVARWVYRCHDGGSDGVEESRLWLMSTARL